MPNLTGALHHLLRLAAARGLADLLIATDVHSPIDLYCPTKAHFYPSDVLDYFPALFTLSRSVHFSMCITILRLTITTQTSIVHCS